VLLGIVIPGLAVRRASSAPNALLALRQVFVSFCLALGVFLVVLVLMGIEEEADPPFSPEAAAGAIVAIGFGLVLLSWRIARQLPCDEGSLVGAYRTQFFLRTAMAETPALLGFVAVFLTGSLWPYLAGLVPAAVGFARNAPTRTHLEREDEKLRDRGCVHSLYALLRESPLPR